MTNLMGLMKMPTSTRTSVKAKALRQMLLQRAPVEKDIPSERTSARDRLTVQNQRWRLETYDSVHLMRCRIKRKTLGRPGFNLTSWYNHALDETSDVRRRMSETDHPTRNSKSDSRASGVISKRVAEERPRRGNLSGDNRAEDVRSTREKLSGSQSTLETGTEPSPSSCKVEWPPL